MAIYRGMAPSVQILLVSTCPMTRLAAFLILTGAIALAACSTPPRARALAGLDLADPDIIAELQDGLSSRERAALATYALLHWEGSKAYCGQPVFRGPQPATIGDAVAKTIAYEDELAAKRAAEKAPKSAIEQKVEEQRQLVDRFEELSLEITRLEDSAMPARQKAARIAELRADLADNRRERAAIDAAPGAAAD